MQIAKQAREYLEQMKALEGDAHKEARRKLCEAVPLPVREEARRIQKAAYFVPENERTEGRVQHLSPSGRYKLVVTPFATGPKSWSYTQGLVYRRDDDKPIAEVQRNYSQFPFAWVEGHEKGDFLLCGEDYQGQTVINLSTTARRDSLPREAFQGFGFCWARIHPSPSGKLLCVDGCFWGAPYELRFYDFADPMCPPWPEISTGEHDNEFFAWVDDQSARVGGFEEFYVPLNRSGPELSRARRSGEISSEDYARYQGDDTNWETRTVSERLWTCPTPLESLARFVDDAFTWRRDPGRSPAEGEVANVKSLLLRLSPTELEEFNRTPSRALLAWALSTKS